jgi:hypothetical protein
MTMTYELDDQDRALLAKCRNAVQDGCIDTLDEDDFRDSVELLVKISDNSDKYPVWPHRMEYLSDLGYVVWRDVFEGKMKCTLDAAVRTHKVAVFVSESEASAWCKHRNLTPELWGGDAELMM